MSSHPFADLELARRLERCEAMTSRAFVEARARIDPQSGAAVLERGGAMAMFDGPQSPLTQTFCLGLFAPLTDADLDEIEQFLLERGASPAHEVSPLAGMATIDALVRRGYRPVELTSVLYQIVAPSASWDGRVRVRIASPSEADEWSAVAAEGWGNAVELQAFLRDVGRVSAQSAGASMFFAEIDGRPIATASLSIHDGVAHLAGASTIPSARKQGAQRALLEARLRYAAERGCDLATMGAEPGSASQRNAERRGFRVAYTRVKWGRGEQSPV